MTATSILFDIAVALIVAKLFSFICEKMKQPGVIGEILAGVILGPTLIGSLSGSSITLLGTTLFTFQLDLASPEFKDVALIGTIFLMFIIGMETDPEGIKKSRKSGLITCVFGVIVPFFSGFLVGILFNLGVTVSLAIGAIFTASSITLTIRMFEKLELLSTRVGLTMLTADILDDILGIFILALVLGQGNPFVLVLRVVLFFFIILIVGVAIIRYTRKETTKRQTPLLALTLGLTLCFMFAAFAENMGLAAIIGAFFAGVIIRRTPQAHVINDYANTIGYALFIPLFFVGIGASFSFGYLSQHQELGGIGLFILVFMFFALISKVIGCYLGARFSGFTKRESLIVGYGMMPRGGVTLIIVTTEIQWGVFGDPAGNLAQQAMIATIILIAVSTFITPFMLKRSVVPPYMKKRKTFFTLHKK